MREDLQMAAEGLEAHALRAEQAELRRQEIEEKMQNTKLQMDALREAATSDMQELQRVKDEELRAYATREEYREHDTARH
ncbi:hypothetical protein PINS_up017307 [Pythium insidiosum]|nr:hypothetical protein PINS_up017307 [Pythium insidiosum]